MALVSTTGHNNIAVGNTNGTHNTAIGNTKGIRTQQQEIQAAYKIQQLGKLHGSKTQQSVIFHKTQLLQDF